MAEQPAGNWASEVQRHIATSEYEIRYQEQVDALQSPNRAQDLRITYWPDGFQLKPRTSGEDWQVDLRVEGIGKDGDPLIPVRDPAINVSGNALVADHGSFTMDYRNDEAGMRQNFVVKQKPEGQGLLEVRMRYSGGLTAHDKGGGAILFTSFDLGKNEHTSRVWYKDLVVWDANGDTLEATASVQDDRILLAVNDVGATYPITIDPLTTTAVWTGDSGQSAASYGYAVSTAGDVNGDGYSDVVVSAIFYDGGLNNQGRIYVYHGSATGLNTIPDATRQQLVADVCFGFDVSTAGDVNGDGFSDIAVIEEGTSITNGRLFIYHGSTSGIAATASTTVNLNYGLVFWNVACAGDVNDDGFSDVVIGAPWANSDRGMVYVYHGSAGGILTPAARSITGSQVDARLGHSVSSGGDLNGDGISDIVMSQIFWSNGSTEEGRIVAYHGTAGSGLTGGIPALPDWSYEGGSNFANLASSVAFAGDVNGDGYSDIIAGRNYSNPELQEGLAICFHGSATGLGTIPNWSEEINLANSAFGSSVCGAGDYNGDGYADVIISATVQDGTFTDQGAAYVYAGGAGGLNAAHSWTVTGGQNGALFGSSVSTAGDVNGDGFSDVIVGASSMDNPTANEGAAYVFTGSAAGLSTSTLATRDGGQNNAQLGFSVSAAGDVNADGFSDMIAGANLYDNGQTDEGRAYLFHGAVAGLPVTANWTAESNQAGAQFGASVSTAGDVNGDGYADVIIGADLYDNGQVDEGGTFVYTGSAAGLGATASWTAESDQAGALFGTSVASAGDVNGDGYSDVVVGSPSFDNGQADEGRAFAYHGSSTGLSATVAWTTESDQASAAFGRSVAGVGDVDADGYGDVVVGAYLFDGGQANEGRAFLYRGRATGLRATPDWTAESDQADAQFGFSVALAGDVNADGRSDVIIGAPLYDGGQTNEGRAYGYYGNITGLPPGPSWTVEENISNANFDYSVSMAGNVNGDGYGAVVVGAPNASNGRMFVYHGSAAGSSTTYATNVAGAQSGERFGASVSMIGSISGDGYADVVVGAPLWDGIFTSPDRGRLYLFYGNGGFSSSKRTRQYRSDLVTVVQPSNGTFVTTCEWGIGQYARSWMGRRDMKLVWELMPHGPAFSGVPVTNSVASTAQTATWTDVDVATGEEIKQLVTLMGSSYPRWRARLRHRPNTMIDGQVFSRWYYFGINDKQAPSIKTEYPDCGPLPIELLSFEGHCAEGRVHLNWTTATEQDNAFFTVSRSTDGHVWSEAGRVEGAGMSHQTLEYEFIDPLSPPADVLYYRLSQTDLDGTTQSFPAIAMNACGDQGTVVLSVYPNPTNGMLDVVVVDAGLEGGARLECVDAQGRIVIVHPFNLDPVRASAGLDLSTLVPGVYTLRLLQHDVLVGTPVRVIRQ